MVATFIEVLRREQEALSEVYQRLSHDLQSIDQACDVLLSVGSRDKLGRVVVSGIGKAGIVARKVAATLSSVGTAAAFMHPVEAVHGDLGFIRDGDCGLLFSYSGETVELVRFAAEISGHGCALVVVTRSKQSSLARMAAACVEMGEVREACYLGLAPSSSTTVMLAIGDALALAVARGAGFSEAEFGRNHPAGYLGLQCRRVDQVMRTGSRLVIVDAQTAVKEVVERVSAAKTGAAVIVNQDRSLLGLFTDGDLRRSLLRHGHVLDCAVRDFASVPCQSIRSGSAVSDAVKVFQNNRIEELPVVELETNRVLGLLCLKDIAVF